MTRSALLFLSASLLLSFAGHLAAATHWLPFRGEPVRELIGAGHLATRRLSLDEGACLQIRIKVFDLNAADYVVGEWRREGEDEKILSMQLSADEDAIQMFRAPRSGVYVLAVQTTSDTPVSVAIDLASFAAPSAAALGQLELEPNSQENPQVVRLRRDRQVTVTGFAQRGDFDGFALEVPAGATAELFVDLETTELVPGKKGTAVVEAPFLESKGSIKVRGGSRHQLSVRGVGAYVLHLRLVTKAATGNLSIEISQLLQRFLLRETSRSNAAVIEAIHCDPGLESWRSTLATRWKLRLARDYAAGERPPTDALLLGGEAPFRLWEAHRNAERMRLLRDQRDKPSSELVDPRSRARRLLLLSRLNVDDESFLAERRWIRAVQKADGSWGDASAAAERIEATAACVRALSGSEFAEAHHSAIRFLLANQNTDGLWGARSGNVLVSLLSCIKPPKRIGVGRPASHSDSIDRALAGIASWSLDHEVALPHLLVWLDSPLLALRYRAVLALGRVNSDSATEVLRAQLGDSAAVVRGAAAEAWRWRLMNDEAWEESLEILEGGNALARLSVMRALDFAAPVSHDGPGSGWDRLIISFARALNKDDYAPVRSAGLSTSFKWWACNPPIRDFIELTWIEFLGRPDGDGAVTQAALAEFRTRMLRAGGSRSRLAALTDVGEYAEAQRQFAKRVRSSIDGLEDTDPERARRLERRWRD